MPRIEGKEKTEEKEEKQTWNTITLFHLGRMNLAKDISCTFQSLNFWSISSSEAFWKYEHNLLNNTI